MQQGLIIDSLRGMCGTGIYAYSDKSKEALEFKRALPGPDFINSHQFEMFKKDVTDFNVVIGHNRASTIGAAKDSNCHPFVYDHIGLVHNGTLRDYYSLNQGFNHPVDSAHAAYSMAKNGTLHTLERAKGAYVFAWHDRKEGTFNLARNGMRDIWFITDKEGENLYFASEYKMLDWVLDRNSIEASGKYLNPAEFTLCTWDLSAKSLKKPKVQVYEEFKEPVKSWQGRNNWDGQQDQMWRHRDATDLRAINVGYAEVLKLENPTFAPYGGSKEVHPYTDGVVFSVQKHPQTDGTTKEILFKIHNVRFGEWDTKWKHVPVLGAKAYSTHQERSGDKQIVVVCRVLTEIAEGTVEDAMEGDDTNRLFRGPLGRFIRKDDFIRLVSGGCLYCGDPLDVTDESSIKWADCGGSYEPLCSVCATDPQISKDVEQYYGGTALRVVGPDWRDYYE